jgi:RND family efflux transporter MFP subunit
MMRPTLVFGIAASALAPAAWSKPFECLIQPAEVIEMRSPVLGVIEKIAVQRGDNIKKGQVLVELDSNVERSAMAVSEYRAKMAGRLKAAAQRYENSSKKLDRAQELVKQSFVAAQARDDALAEARVAEADLEDARENQELAKLDYRHAADLVSQRTLRSPFDGVVMDRLLNPGDLTQYSTDSKAILKLARIDPMRVEVVLPLAYYGKLRPGMVGRVVPETLGGEYQAAVTVVDRVFDAASGTFRVRMDLPNKQGNVPGGLRCQVEFPQLPAADNQARTRGAITP